MIEMYILAHFLSIGVQIREGDDDTAEQVACYDLHADMDFLRST